MFTIVVMPYFSPFNFLFDDAGPGEPDAHRRAEATHAAEGFPRHLKRLQKHQRPPPDLCLLLLSFLCALTLFCSSQLAYFLLLLRPNFSSSSHSHCAAESQNGTTVSSQPSSFGCSSRFWVSERHFPCGFTG